MNIVGHPVGIAAALVFSGSEVVAGDDLRTAPAALAGPAPRGSHDACPLYRNEDGLTLTP